MSDGKKQRNVGRPNTQTTLTGRRRFIGALGATTATLALRSTLAESANFSSGASLDFGGSATGTGSLTVDMSASIESTAQLPGPGDSGIEHIIVVMMENRSFDHYLGWLPGADGKQAGLSFTDRNGLTHSTFHLTEFQTCNYQDPDHSYEGGRIQYDEGACDGWLRGSGTDLLPVSYYIQDDLAFYGKAAPGWTTFDRYFSAIMAETYPNRIYMHAAQTDRIHNSTVISALPTIWDGLAARGLTGTYYYGDTPFLALWGPKYIPISKPFDAFLTDCAAGTLPNVCFVDPRFGGEGQGISSDDHPTADIRNGQALLGQIYNAVTHSPCWKNTVLFINYDEWGGFFDHVPPPVAPIPEADQVAGNQDGLLGFRVPCIMISPFARRGYVSHMPYDHTSILKMIEWRWSLAPLTVRDATANNIAKALDFKNPNLAAPPIAVPQGPFGTVCSSVNSSSIEDFASLASMAKTMGFSIY